MPAAPHVPSQTPGAAGAASGQCRGVRPWAPPGSSHDNHPLFKEPEQAVPLHYSHGNVGMERGSLSPGNNVGAGSWGVWVGCGRGCFAEDGGALRRWGLGRGPQRCWGPPPTAALAGRWDSRSVGWRARSSARSAKSGELVHCLRMGAGSVSGSEPRVRAECAENLCWTPAWAGGTPAVPPTPFSPTTPKSAGTTEGQGATKRTVGPRCYPGDPVSSLPAPSSPVQLGRILALPLLHRSEPDPATGTPPKGRGQGWGHLPGGTQLPALLQAPWPSAAWQRALKSH